MCNYIRIIFCCFAGQLFAQQNTYVKIANEQNLDLVFYDYLSQDSLFSSNENEINFSVDNENKLKTLIVIDNQNHNSNIIILDNDSLFLEVGLGNNINFKDKTNQNYQVFKRGLDSLKNIKSGTNEYIYSYMFNHPELLISLKYVKLGVIYKIHTIDSCKSLFSVLDTKLEGHSLYKEINLLFKPTTKLNKGDIVPFYELIDTNNKTTKLNVEDKSAVLIFWASWCVPCLNKLDLVVKHIDYFSDYNIVLINIDEDIESWYKWNKNYSLFQNLHIKNGFSNTMARELSINKIPTNVLLSEKGEILNLDIKMFKNETQNIVFYYKSNEYFLDKSKIKLIDSVLFEKDIQNMELTGYTDKVGSVETNIILATNRSNEIKNYIQSIDSLIEIKENNFGEINSSNTDLKLNRKVEMSFSYTIPSLQFNSSYNLIFEHLKFGINSKNRNVLLNILTEIELLENYKIKIATFSCGHEGVLTYNNKPQTLSQSRARILKRYFIKNGINENDIIINDEGVDNAFENKSYTHNFKRRAEIIIEKQ